MVKHQLAYSETLNCVQCGYCLPSCPTYVTFKKETHSPRGRINLVKMAAEGRISYKDMEDSIDLCLGCRACETACPIGVEYGKILESAVAAIAEQREQEMTVRNRIIKSMLLNHVVPKNRILNAMGAGLAIYQKTGIQKIARKSGILKIIPENLGEFEKVLPVVQGAMQKRKRQKHYDPNGKQLYKVGFFKGCIMDTMFSSINTLSIKLLQSIGCEVTVISEQQCCGALHQHSGEIATTITLAKKNIEAFEQYHFDFIVNSIGGCGAMLIEYEKVFADDPEWAERAKQFSGHVVDISVILSKHDLPFTKEIISTVTYQPSCHMTNVQKNVKAPLALLKQIPGIQYVELQEKDMCCGSAGIYNIVKYEESMKILNNKMKYVKEINPEPAIIVTTNPGCHLQMKLGIEREGLKNEIRTVHLVELLSEACGISI
ncbi:(Fe-S)-binding protein [Rummeliibacillus sp. NPDC094406]|uniref:(Fe-S)-binding protein n=1 Tax=Rummeliibacillus sp. NPDC094406 TaxID=3364511 RepID=UPI0038307527